MCVCVCVRVRVRVRVRVLEIEKQTERGRKVRGCLSLFPFGSMSELIGVEIEQRPHPFLLLAIYTTFIFILQA